MLICSELIMIVRDSGKGFACYIGDLLSRCKVQKVVLHCVLSSVHNMQMLATYQEYSYMVRKQFLIVSKSRIRKISEII